MTAYCLSLLDSKLRPLKQCQAEGGLLPQVTCPTSLSPFMRSVKAFASDHLLHTVFCVLLFTLQYCNMADCVLSRG